jgi:hypothetical protein
MSTEPTDERNIAIYILTAYLNSLQHPRVAIAKANPLRDQDEILATPSPERAK